MNNDTTIRVPDVVEHDINVVLPNGEKIVLQYRNEGDYPSLDICFEKMRPVLNWERDMKDAKKIGRGKEFGVFQLWIGLDPEGEPY